MVVATGTASGKSLAYLVPVLTALLDGSEAPNGRGATALYLAPTKALAADQRRAVKELAAPLGNARPPRRLRRRHARSRNASGSASTPTTSSPTRTCCTAGYSRPTPAGPPSCAPCATSSSTSATPTAASSAPTSPRCCAGCAACAPATAPTPSSCSPPPPPPSPRWPPRRLTGLPVAEVTDDASPRGELVFALWEPPLTELHGEKGAPVRRTATAETADLLTDLDRAGRPHGRLRTLPARRRAHLR